MGADPLNYFCRGLRVVAPNGDNLFWPEIIPFPPSPPPPSENMDVKTSLGMLHLFCGVEGEILI